MPRKPRENITRGILPISTLLDGDDTIVTYSELDVFRQCPLKHRWAYDLLMTKTQPEGSPLAKGTLWHNVMETYYYHLALGHPSIESAELAAHKHLLDDFGEFRSSDAELVSWMLEGHLHYYGLDDDWEILAVELSGMLPLGLRSDSLPRGRSKIWLQYKIDMLVREISTGRIWIVDHKTASAFSQQIEIDLDDQFGLYIWALRQAGVNVFGFIRSDARTQRNKGPMKLENRFRRVPTHRTEVELENIRVDALNTARLMRQQPLGVRSSPDPRQCVWKCDFLQAHLMFRKTDRTKRTEVDILEGFGFAPRELRHREYAATYPPLP